MTDPQPLSDVDLLVWAVVLGYRARQQRAGLKFVLMPFPPCPTCGEGVHSVNQVDREVGITRTTSLTMQPCGHAHTATDDDVFPLLRHIDDLMDRVERGDRSTDPNVHGWTVDDIAQAARVLIAPQVPLSGPESVPQASGGELAGRNGDGSTQTASSDALRERLVESLEHYPVASWTPRNLAGRVMGVVGGELDRSDEAARTAEHGRQMAVECFTVYRNDAKQLHATLAEVLDAFEAYWARTDYCGPSETAVQPEHFRAWRDMLRPEALDAAREGAVTQATDAETTTRVIALHEQWVKAGPPPLGVPLARWWDRRLAELHAAILDTTDQPQERP